MPEATKDSKKATPSQKSKAGVGHPFPPSAEILYLIDISSFIFRAFYAIRTLHNAKGEPTQAVYGVATMMARLAEEAKPDHLAVVYDSKEGESFRKTLYPLYKANRSETPPDLIPQFPRIESLIEEFEIHSYRQNGLEADDLIATLTTEWKKKSSNHCVVIVSSDKDLMQLVDPKVVLWDTMKNAWVGEKEVFEKFQVRPDQIRDYLALTGDSSDNIPGVPGVGPKTASTLLAEYSTLSQILLAAKEGKIAGRTGALLTEHESKALISAELATVKHDLPIELNSDQLKYHFHITPNGITLLKELGFHTLVTRWKDVVGHKLKKEGQTSELSLEPDELPRLPKGPFRCIQTQEALDALLQKIKAERRFGFDLETTSLNPREAQIVGIAICPTVQESYYIPVGHRAEGDPSVTHQLNRASVLKQLKPILEDPNALKIGQNLKFDFSILEEQGIHAQGIECDTMIGAYLLDPSGRHNLTTLAMKYLNYPVTTYEEVCGKGKSQITFDQVPIDQATHYSAEDAWIALRLWETESPLLKSENLVEVFEKVELPLVPILTQMELEGVCIDSDWLAHLSKEMGDEIAGIESQIQSYAKAPVNLNSPKQLAVLLFEELKLPTQGKTKTGYSTDAGVLEALAPLHDVPKLLLEYRELSKLKGTYVDPLPTLKDPKTGKIHTSFHQTVAATGRLSSSDPNLQNIPIRTERGMQIRRAFIASPGNLLISSDYSQIELRLLAHMSQDAELVKSFQKDEDVHRRTASELFGIPPEHVSDEQRGIAKAINFGLLYGKTPFGLAQELSISRKEADSIIKKYFERYSGIKEFLDRQIASAKHDGFVTTLIGRKRWLPDIQAKNPMVRGFAERMAMNSPIQGSAADLMKLAMIEIDRDLKKGNYRAKMIIQVHDEIVLDCPKSEVQAITQLVPAAMARAMTLSVPLRANCAVGENWMEMEEVK